MAELTKKLVVVGQGYVGLPVAMRAVEVGFNVVGIDLDESRIRRLSDGDSYVEDISYETLDSALKSDRYLPTSDYKDCNSFDYAIITVPTPLKESLPDLSFIESAALSLSSKLSRGATVVLESTTYPGTTEELLAPILERGSGLKVGEDFYLGYSPERIDPGNQTWDFVRTPKVISGVGEESLASVKGLYDSLVERTVPVSSPKEAELTKLLENTFRHVNIALVNELSVFAHQLGVNVWESIEAAGTKPFGFMKFTPGPGVGGHCLPIDPSYLSWQVRRKLGKTFRFVELANDVNDHMPDYVAERLLQLLNSKQKPMFGARIGLVGLAYKKNSGDMRESPARRIISLLLEYGAEVVGFDEHVDPEQWPAEVQRCDFEPANIDGLDAIVVLTNHDSTDLRVLEDSSVPILDTQNCVKGTHVELL
ncbi:nucleotide sugar dehydrogenase [Paramicrobacterium fandaimingii]|uniref:nucleotide sugar dehydrogenase n=1 Tax=Paramicrobacterium fandaimingii TaxID=2708079 RepID=UPI001420DD00|nr:nucleotide sugar dehydrogenase [Microbacterium fandaimingii]